MAVEKGLNEMNDSPYLNVMAIAMVMLDREIEMWPDKFNKYNIIRQEIINTLGANSMMLKKYLSSLNGYYFQYDEFEAYNAGVQSQERGWECGFGLIMHLLEMRDNKYVQASKKRIERYSARLRQALGSNGILLDEFTQLYRLFNCSSRAKAKYFYNLGYQTNKEREI